MEIVGKWATVYRESMDIACSCHHDAPSTASKISSSVHANLINWKSLFAVWFLAFASPLILSSLRWTRLKTRVHLFTIIQGANHASSVYPLCLQARLGTKFVFSDSPSTAVLTTCDNDGISPSGADENSHQMDLIHDCPAGFTNGRLSQSSCHSVKLGACRLGWCPSCASNPKTISWDHCDGNGKEYPPQPLRLPCYL